MVGKADNGFVMADGTSLSPVAGALDPARPGGGLPGQEAEKPKGLDGKPRKTPGDTVELSADAKAQVAKLQARDAEVKAHEQAHMAAGAGIVTGGASYSYQRGPDGRAYAVGGEVSIDASPVKGNPQATITKAMRIQAAALAPADPSGQDRAVAAQAATMAAQAANDAAKASTASAEPGKTGTDKAGADKAGPAVNGPGAGTAAGPILAGSLAPPAGRALAAYGSRAEAQAGRKAGLDLMA